MVMSYAAGDLRISVEPAASVPLAGKRSGAFYAIINLGPTAHDEIADLRIEGDACKVLPELVTGYRTASDIKDV